MTAGFCSVPHIAHTCRSDSKHNNVLFNSYKGKACDVEHESIQMILPGQGKLINRRTAHGSRMRKMYLFITRTLSDWEYGNTLAELGSGRYLRDPSMKYQVVLCGNTLEPVTTMGGIILKPDIHIEDIQPDRDDIVLLPGADTWLEPSQELVIAKVRELLIRGTVVAAICGATFGLADAGLLDNRPHTSNDIQALRMCCPHYKGQAWYVDKPAVTDDNLITASGLAPVEFAYQIFRRLDVMSPAVLEAWYGLFSTRKPDFFYTLMESIHTAPVNH